MAFDYIIVGGGSAGCVLANRLSEDPSIKVLLLEAGGGDANPLFRMPAGFAKMTKGVASWGWSTVPQKHLNGRVIWYTQAKVIGGGSSINAQLYTRGNAKDYDSWVSDAGCEGWSYREVLPYFKRSRGQSEAASTPITAMADRWASPIPSTRSRSATRSCAPRRRRAFPSTTISTAPCRTAWATINCRRATPSALRPPAPFCGPRAGGANLTVRLNTPTLKIIDRERPRGRRDELAAPAPWRRFARDREIILSCGAMGSPRLLQLSGIGPADALKAGRRSVVHDLPGVGSNLQDHLDLYAIAECTGDHTYDRVAQPHRTVWAGIQYLLFKTGPVTSTLFETGGFWYADKSARSPDIQFHLGLGSGIEAGRRADEEPGRDGQFGFPAPALARHGAPGERRSRRRASDRSQLLGRSLRPRMRAKGLRIAREILRQPALKPFVLAERLPGDGLESDAELIQYAYRSCKTDHHPVGTCAMGTGPDAVTRRSSSCGGSRACASPTPR